MIRAELEESDVTVITPLVPATDPQEVEEAEVEKDHSELKEPLLKLRRKRHQLNNQQLEILNDEHIHILKKCKTKYSKYQSSLNVIFVKLPFLKEE